MAFTCCVNKRQRVHNTGRQAEQQPTGNAMGSALEQPHLPGRCITAAACPCLHARGLASAHAGRDCMHVAPQPKPASIQPPSQPPPLIPQHTHPHIPCKSTARGRAALVPHLRRHALCCPQTDSCPCPWIQSEACAACQTYHHHRHHLPCRGSGCGRSAAAGGGSRSGSCPCRACRAHKGGGQGQELLVDFTWL